MLQPVIVIICCEGKQSEPQYFRAVIKQRRVAQGRVKVHVLGSKGQHKKLVDNCRTIRANMSREKEVEENDIEVWAVCDKDKMDCTLAELQKYARDRNVSLAFSDPRFEAYLLQHFGYSATSSSGKSLETELNRKLKTKTGKTYQKNDLSWVIEILDNEPVLLDTAIANADKLSDQNTAPYITVQNLVRRLIELAPPAD